MNLIGIVWLRDVVDKLAWKHNVTTDEVEEVLKGAYFVRKTTGEALIVSARDMTEKEKKSYAKK
jgi:hypothetical protein